MANLVPEPAADPRRVADVVLASAVRAGADAVYLEPAPGDAYVVTFERASSVLATTTLDAHLGAAVIARLSFLANVDLSSPSPASGVLPVQTGAREADAVITVRPGTSLRADVMVMPRGRRRGSAPPLAAGLAPGGTVGHYRVLERLGEGGMGTVFHVEHAVLGRHYALKVLRAKVVDRDPTAADRFVREARAAARIRHPNIVDVFDFGHLADGRPYFVMELLTGESLADRAARGALPPAEVVAIARQLARGLGAAHDCGVIHADVTPSNALIVAREDGEGEVKLLDFGLAELAGEAAFGEESDFVLGTPAYISPEQLRGLAPTDRSNQYGLGCVLFELLAGAPPFHDRDLRALCMKHIEAPIPTVTSPFGPLPSKLADVITTCLQKSPAARFPNMRALDAALDEIERVVDRRGWRKWLSS